MGDPRIGSVKVEVGQIAPDFTLPDHQGTPISLSDFRGRKVVLYFYPKADSPGCTTQACGIRDRSDEYEGAGAAVVGISHDEPNDLAEFRDEFDLDFTLLADADHKVADRYGVWVEKSMYGHTHWGFQRATFVLDEDGRVLNVFPKVSPKTHDDAVLGALEAANAG